MQANSELTKMEIPTMSHSRLAKTHTAIDRGALRHQLHSFDYSRQDWEIAACHECAAVVRLHGQACLQMQWMPQCCESQPAPGGHGRPVELLQQSWPRS